MDKTEPSRLRELLSREIQLQNKLLTRIFDYLNAHNKEINMVTVVEELEQLGFFGLFGFSHNNILAQNSDSKILENVANLVEMLGIEKAKILLKRKEKVGVPKKR